jgi:TetR/AcrR family transcriptional repressor of nem operon
MGRTSNTRERLLQVTFDLIWQQSYGSVSVEDICQRAKVKKGSFYHFFPSKCDLAVAAYEEYWQRNRPHYDRAFSTLVPPLERLENYCRHIYEGQRERQLKTGRVLGCPFASVGCELSTQDEKIRQKSEEMFDRHCKYIETALRDAHKEGLVQSKDFAGKAQATFSFIMGRLVQAKIKNDAEVLRDLYPYVLQLIGAKVVG